MNRYFVLFYGVVCYTVFFITFLYLIGFVGGLVVPTSVNMGPAGSVLPAVLVNLGLIGLFGLQHSVMARPGFKRWWTRYVPEAVERSTYVLLASAVLVLLFVLWQPLPQVLWRVDAPALAGALWGLFGLGWGLVLLSTFLINHFHLFGLQQVYLHLRRQRPAEPAFRTPFLYRLVRHPLMLGFLIAFWAAPVMTLGRLVFALGMSAYILVALVYEERDLAVVFGERYEVYRQRVPKLIPNPWRKRERVSA